MRTLSVSVDVDVDLQEIARSLALNCEEDRMLEALAKENIRVANQSGDTTEKAFALKASERLYELAKWFRENQP